PAGSVAVEILYKDGEVVRGYEKDNCNIFTGDELHHTVTWKNKPDFNHLRNKLIRLRFYLKQARLYSFQCILSKQPSRI
ncbi:MAG: hypothetical protein ACE5NG_14320, partial [bacterium]